MGKSVIELLRDLADQKLNEVNFYLGKSKFRALKATVSDTSKTVTFFDANHEREITMPREFIMMYGLGFATDITAKYLVIPEGNKDVMFSTSGCVLTVAERVNPDSVIFDASTGSLLRLCPTDKMWSDADATYCISKRTIELEAYSARFVPFSESLIERLYDANPFELAEAS